MFGIEWDGPLPHLEDEAVGVPAIDCPLLQHDALELQQTIIQRLSVLTMVWNCTNLWLILFVLELLINNYV